ncbi:hypothetical protein N644_0877 [Lactiplantibacillus paraplantarum]|nr:hypothetical protein N644_0877 [Lactiplantibacillus paraplantarum]
MRSFLKDFSSNCAQFFYQDGRNVRQKVGYSAEPIVHLKALLINPQVSN